MSRIGLIGDPHAKSAPLRAALTIFKHQAVDRIWCVGDIAGYGDELDASVDLLREHGCLAIRGNHEQWMLERHANELSPRTRSFMQALPEHVEEVIDDVRVYMVHASPPQSLTAGIRLLDIEGRVLAQQRDYWTTMLRDFPCDVLIVGHTHQVFAEQLADTLLINPGSCRFNHCCGILTLPERQCQWFALPGKTLVKAWNWGREAGALDADI